MKRITYKKHGVLTFEFSLLIIVIFMVFMSFYSLFLLIEADKKVYSAVDDAAKSLRTSIYLSSISKREVYASNLVGLGEYRLKQLGILSKDSNYIVNVTKGSIETGIKTKARAMLKLGTKHNVIEDNLAIDISAKGRSMFVHSEVSLNLPIIRKVYGEVKLGHCHIIAANGIEKLLSTTCDYSNFVENSKIAITLHGKNVTKVYHTKRCFAMLVSNADTTDYLDKKKYYTAVSSNGSIYVDGVEYHICPFCKGR